MGVSNMTLNFNSIEQGKKNAAYQAVDENIKNGDKVGIGSGSTVVYAVNRLAERVKREKLSVTCVPTSFQSRQLIIDAGLHLSDLELMNELDITIDGADDIDKKLNLIKGGGGCHVQEKIVASITQNLIIIADERKKSEFLGESWKKGIPIEIIPFALTAVSNKIKNIGGKPELRMAKAKAGPVVSDNGNLIIDADFGIIKDPAKLENSLLHIPGVIDVGLFINMAKKAYIGNSQGTCEILFPE